MDKPFAFSISTPEMIPAHFDEHVQRRLSSLAGQFLDLAAYQEMLAMDDPVIYDVYQFRRPEKTGDLLFGITHLHRGKVGSEFFMTKGHFHVVLETAEIYYCLRGEGYMVMEDPAGNTSVELLTSGTVLYVPPCWGHRAVCTGRQEDLVFYFVYPAQAGHDYARIEKQGFGKLVVEGSQGVEIVDNPHWKKIAEADQRARE